MRFTTFKTSSYIEHFHLFYFFQSKISQKFLLYTLLVNIIIVVVAVAEAPFGGGRGGQMPTPDFPGGPISQIFQGKR